MLSAAPAAAWSPVRDEVLIGQVSPDVAAVQVVTADGCSFRASAANGYFLAWWPGAAAPRTVTAVTANGVIAARLTPPAAASEPPTPTREPT